MHVSTPTVGGVVDVLGAFITSRSRAIDVRALRELPSARGTRMKDA